MRKHHRGGGFVFGAVIGSSLGALTAFLFATKKGHIIQKAITAKYHEMEDAVSAKYQEMEHAVEKSASKAVKKAVSKPKIKKAIRRIEKKQH